MSRIDEDPIREDRIRNEAIVDVYGPEEQAMGWYYYLADNIDFPFQARCIYTLTRSPLKEGETVEVLGMLPEVDCEHDMLVRVQLDGRSFGVLLSQLEPLEVDESTEETIGDWHYWVQRGYQF